jgi:hypothetical protein
LGIHLGCFIYQQDVSGIEADDQSICIIQAKHGFFTDEWHGV